MKKISWSLSVTAAALLAITGCGGNGDDPKGGSTIHKLSPQGGNTSYIFYGESNPSGLGALKNVKIADNGAPKNPLLHDDNTTAVGYPVLSTALEYNPADQSYQKLHADKLHYVSKGKAYTVAMAKGSSTSPTAVQNSSADNLSKPAYTKVNYLGSRYYLTAKSGDSTVLITPDMQSDDAPIPFDNKKLLSVTSASYGASINGYLVYDSDQKKVQKCDTTLASCDNLLDAGSRDFKGDVAGTTYSVILHNGTLYRLDKKDGTKEEVSLGKTIKRGHGTSTLQGGDFYFIATDGNLYKTDIRQKKVIKLTKTADQKLERIRAVTNKWVIAGSDTFLAALKKDGSSDTPVKLVENTKTEGYKYVTLGTGNGFLYVRYNLDPETGNTAYSSCIFKEGKTECKEDSFWAGITAKTSGKFNTQSSYNYTPYAYIRVDETDNFGGGTLKAIDPEHPLEDGITLGKAPNYNFQTFISGYRYLNELIDSDGGVVLYAKNDTNFHVDAFYMNLLKENSLVQLTDTDPTGFNKGRDHCHGRHCMICHNLAAGKIYKDLNGTKSAYGYKIRLDFEDGTNFVADVSKGKGENFSMPIQKITGNFKANILDASGAVVNHSAGYYHKGREYADCNYCHARNGQTRFDAPGAISIK